jgi:hypothetical protein
MRVARAVLSRKVRHIAGRRLVWPFGDLSMSQEYVCEETGVGWATKELHDNWCALHGRKLDEKLKRRLQRLLERARPPE